MTRTGTTNTKTAKWETKRLGTLLRLSMERIEPSEHAATLFNYVGLEHIESHTGRILPHDDTPGSEIKSTKNVFRPGQILYGKLRPYLNKVHLAGAKGICSTDIFVLEPKGSALLAAFAAYYLRSSFVLSRVESLMEGASLPRMNQKDLLGLPIHVPPRAEQERIVRVLDESEGLRTLRRHADQRTNDLIPAMFHDMFGDPAPNPYRHEVVPFESIVASAKLGLVRGAKEMNESRPFAYVRMDAITRDGTLSLDPIKRVDASPEELVEFALRRGDFLFNTRNSRELVGKTALFDAAGTYLFNNNIMRMRFRQNADPWYITALFQTDGIRRQLETQKSGTTSVVAIYWKALRTVLVPLPPFGLQRKFAAGVADVRELEAKQAASRRRLDDLFQSLLHRAFRGELTQPATPVIVSDQASREDQPYRRAAIATYVVKRLHRRKTFGRVQLAKTPYLTETHVGVPLAGRYHRAAAGPLDLKALDEVETLAAERRWFSKHQRAGEKKGYFYKPGPTITEAVKTAEAILGDRRSEMDRLLNLMAGWNTDQAEMVATLFAAWNDFLLDGVKPTDQQIIDEVRENWHVNKQKLTPYRLKKMLNLMRREHLIPRGIGPKTMPSREKSLWQSLAPRT